MILRPSLRWLERQWFGVPLILGGLMMATERAIAFWSGAAFEINRAGKRVYRMPPLNAWGWDSIVFWLGVGLIQVGFIWAMAWAIWKNRKTREESAKLDPLTRADEAGMAAQ